MKNLRRIPVVLAFLCSLWALCPIARAAIIYDNLENSSFGAASVAPNTGLAQRFNSDSTNLRLNSVTLKLAAGTPAPIFTLSLYSDLAGTPGVSVGTLFSGTRDVSDHTLFSNLSQAMLPNTNYWLVLSVASTDTSQFGWFVAQDRAAGSGPGFQQASARSLNYDTGRTWSSFGATFQSQLVAVPAPEPANPALLLPPALAFLARRSSRGKALGSGPTA
ncbi:MAG: proteinsorting protein [Phycisphaerales bacterium]|nr:proteinsorting protein [Phycisphaerales bacterium]